MSARDTSFYYSFFVLPPSKRRAIVAVWDFCRALDDAVDVDVDEDEDEDECSPGAPPDRTSIHAARAALGRWRRELDACYGRRLPETPQGRVLQPYIIRFRLPRTEFEAVIEGVEMDLAHRRYETFDALYEYCVRVASAVGLICLEIFGCRDPRARTYAVDLGVALQLTNIIRDIAGDLDRGRLYVPLEDMARFGCTEDDLRLGIVTDRIQALLRHQCDRARSYYKRAWDELPAVDGRRLVAAEIMGAIYFDLLRRIENKGYDVFKDVVRVPRPRRALIAASTWAKAMLGC